MDIQNNYLYYMGSRLIRNMRIKKVVKRKFPEVYHFMKGMEKSTSINKSIVYFTVHRCASRYVANILGRFARDSGMVHLDIAGYTWHGGEVIRNSNEIYRKSGYYYGPYYGLDEEEYTLPIPDLEDFKIILVLRTRGTFLPPTIFITLI